jgi:hypothetical protein
MAVKIKRALFSVALWLGMVGAALAQANSDTSWPTPANNYVPGVVQACINTAGKAVPCVSGAAGVAGFPVGATPITASATGTTAATTATLAAVAGKTTYICGYQIGSTATAAAAGNATITGTITVTLNVEMGTGTSPAVVQTQSTFNPCVPASGTNQAIAVVSAAPGTGGVISVTAWGFQQ